MKRVVLLYVCETPAIARMAERLRTHFGKRRVLTCQGQLMPGRPDDTVVVLLSASRSAGEDPPGGLPLDDVARLEASGMGDLFARECVVVPVLLDGAVMPPHTTLPESIRKLAFRHALPIRCDVELDRDLGRLISDLEVHLEYSPGKVYPWHYWLLPIGIAGAVPCSGFMILWLNDLRLWNYSYQTVDRYHQSQFWLTQLGPFLFGAFLFLIGVGWWVRGHRRRAVQRAEHFHTGTGELPARVDPSVPAALVLAVAAIGWGWWGAVPAILFGLTAPVRCACGFSVRCAWRGILVALVIALAAGLWASWKASVVGRFEESLGAYEQGVVAGQEDRLPEARQYFERAIATFPEFGNAYHGLGLVYAREGDDEAAYRELSRAIERYPSEPRGSWGPDQGIVGAAYRNRAKVAAQLGLADQAESDEKEAAKFTPFMDIFGGFFHWW